VLQSSNVGVSFSSSAKDTKIIADFGSILLNLSSDGLNDISFFKMITQTSSINIGAHFSLKGRVI
jgi:3-oxoacyl-[acyl-carrier-protein] synthase II